MMLKPGRELDALVAEKVMGFELKQPKGVRWLENTYVYAINDYRDDGPVYVIDCPCYSTDIAAAWEVVKYFSNKPFNIWISTCGILNAPHFQAILQSKDGRGGNCIGTTVPHAICLAALTAVGSPV